MKIFISYSHDKFQDAEKLSISLKQDDHDVFFDKSSLPKGESYDNQIRIELQSSELLIFLISPEAIGIGSYTLTELQIYQDSFPNPSGRVLPIMIDQTSLDLIPAYLTSVTILQPKGNTIADVAAKVAELAFRKKKEKFRKIKRLGIITTAVLLIAVVVCFLIFKRTKKEETIQLITKKGFSLFAESNQNSKIIQRVNKDIEFTFLPEKRNGNWALVKLENGLKGWVMAQDMSYTISKTKNINIGIGYGFRGSFWQLFFTSPQIKGAPRNELGINARFADAIDRCKTSLKIAVYEMNDSLIMNSIVEAKQRGIKVQMVTDASSYERSNDIINILKNNGIPVNIKNGAGHLMHNKFAIMDEKIVWTGSWNYTLGATYDNNENEIEIESPEIASVYSKKFDKLFHDSLFTVGSDSHTENQIGYINRNNNRLPFGVQVYFTPEDSTTKILLDIINKASKSIQFMAFIFIQKDLINSLEQKAQNGVRVNGIIEKRFVKNTPIDFLSDSIKGMEVRLDGNSHNLHHDCIIIDDSIVVTGSLNFSDAGSKKNDENLIIIPDATLAIKYNQEFQRLWGLATKFTKN